MSQSLPDSDVYRGPAFGARPASSLVNALSAPLELGLHVAARVPRQLCGHPLASFDLRTAGGADCDRARESVPKSVCSNTSGWWT